MSLMIEKKRGCAIIRCQRKDRLFNTGKKYDTSISIDLGLITLFQKVFEGDRKRMLAWIIATVQEVDGRAKTDKAEAGFSRLIQREMLLLVEKQSKITPLPPPKDQPEKPKRRSKPKERPQQGATSAVAPEAAQEASEHGG